MTRIIRGEPLKKPFFSITRGYTQELWDVTTSCWDVEPNKRPEIDCVLGALTIAAEQWKPEPTRPPLENIADQILAKLKSPLGENEAREVAEALGEVGTWHTQTTGRLI